jgi:predicted dehydrogenase
VLPEQINGMSGGADAMGMQEVGVVLVGAGWIARRHAQVLERLAATRLVGVASRTLGGAQALASEFRAERASTFEALPDLVGHASAELVIVASPNALHAEHAGAALAAGRDVLIEKPLCLGLEQADALIRQAERAGVQLGYAENLCFAPHYRAAREILRSGRLGRLVAARQVERHAGPYSPWFFEPGLAGGGALMDMGCHGVAVLLWLLDLPEPRAVRARLGFDPRRGPLEDEARVEIELDSELVLVSESGWNRASGMESRLELVGSEGSLEIDLLGETGIRLQRRDGAWEAIAPDELALCGYQAQLEAFLAAARAGRRPEIGAREGRAVLEVLLAAYASAAEGGAAIPMPFDSRARS